MGKADDHIAPSVVPSFDITVYLVLDDFGELGRAYRETSEEKADLETVISDMLAGQFNNPIRIVEFNTSEGWSRDCSEDVAWEVMKRANKSGSRLPDSTFKFVSFLIGEDKRLRPKCEVVMSDPVEIPMKGGFYNDGIHDTYDGKEWSEEDIEDLRAAASDGSTLRETATYLCRAGRVSEVAKKAEELGLKFTA